MAERKIIDGYEGFKEHCRDLERGRYGGCRRESNCIVLDSAVRVTFEERDRIQEFVKGIVICEGAESFVRCSQQEKGKCGF